MQTWIEILIRSATLFFLALFLSRILGKQQIVRNTPFHFVTYVVIAIIAALISVNIIKNLVFGFMALGIWVLFTIALDYLAIKSKIAHDIINGKETILIKNGKIMEENLMQLRLTGEELLRELRSKGIFNLADVEFAVMETTGEINALLKSDKKPITPVDMGIKTAPHTAPQTVILDGNIMDEALANVGLNQDWLLLQLEHAGISLKNVFIAQVDSSGDLYLDLFDDVIQIPQPKNKEMLYANLNKSQSDFLKYSLETENKNARSMYAANADKLQNIVKKLEPYLLR